MDEKEIAGSAAMWRMLLALWQQRHSGSLSLESGDVARTFHLHAGRIVGCFSNVEADEPRNLLLKKRNPAALALVSLKNDPSFNPFLPLALVENGLLSLAELLTLLREGAALMFWSVCTWEAATCRFRQEIPSCSLFLNLEIPPLVLRFLQERLERERFAAEIGSMDTVLVASTERNGEAPAELSPRQNRLLSDFAAGSAIRAAIDAHRDTGELPVLADIFYLYLLGLLRHPEPRPDSLPESAGGEDNPPPETKRRSHFFSRRR